LKNVVDFGRNSVYFLEIDN